MAKKVEFGLQKYELTPELKQRMGMLLFKKHFTKLMYKEDGDGYLAYHPFCDTKKKISKEMLGQVRKSHTCPFCFSPITACTKNTKDSNDDFVRIYTSQSGDECYGFYVMYDFDLEKPFWADCEQTYYARDNVCYWRYMRKTLFGDFIKADDSRNDWRYRTRTRYSNYYGCSQPTYEYGMWDLLFSEKKIKEECKKNKREYLEIVAKCISKSNQKKLVIDNLFNEEQIDFIKVFDLKTADEVYRNNSYIRNNKHHINDFLRADMTLNVYYLDYLKKNKIDLGIYFHYLNDLKSLNIPFDKPKDFEHRREVVAEMIRQAKDKELDLKIKKRYNALPKYENEKIKISPFKTAEEIRHCAKVLHNCIGGYVERFANKSTDLFHLDLNGAIKIAIEIQGKTLKQAYGNNNKSCHPRYMTHIRSFCEQNGFSLGRFA